MRGILSALGLALFLVLPVRAQEVSLQKKAERNGEAVSAAKGLSATHLYLDSEVGRQALKTFHEMKAQGLVPLSNTKAQMEEVGDRRDFRVRTNPPTLEFERIAFELRVKEDRFNLWVAVEELGNVSAETLENLRVAFGERTPEGSFNPSAGIIDINEAVFGFPPNIDGDGVTDLLILNIPAATTAGFFDPVDLTNSGNLKDILYMDPEFGEEFLLSTAAHEHQHLILANFDENEDTFINEGLSEWATVLNGYQGRRVTYLNETARYNIPFFRFDRDNLDNVFDDRQRSMLFTTYFADRFGTLAAGRITREPAAGVQGYRNVLAALNAGVTFEDLLVDFHVTNLINDRGVDPSFGYVTDAFINVGAIPGQTFDGRTASSSNRRPFLIPGGVQYVVWRNVEDFRLTLTPLQQNPNLRAQAFLVQGETVTVRDLAFSSAEELFDGFYDRISVVMAHNNPFGAVAQVEHTAQWNVGNTFMAETIVYDDGLVPSEANGNTLTLEAFSLCDPLQPAAVCDARQANRYEVPANAILSSVSVAPYYENDFTNPNVPAGTPRNFDVKVWADNGNGAPGAELFSTTVADTRVNELGGNLVFKEVDLSAFQDQLSDLPPTVYIGLTNVGVDNNFLVMGVTAFTGPNVSFLYLSTFNNGQGAWAAFPNLQVNGEAVLLNRVIPVRVTFLIPDTPVAIEDGDDLPSQVVLAQNYPNPFNPSTTVRYTLPRTAEVRLTIYDVLGREVATLVEGLQPRGVHAVQIEASQWASGLYFYSLDADGQKLTRQMVLLK